jgi:hypothetical protein
MSGKIIDYISQFGFLFIKHNLEIGGTAFTKISLFLLAKLKMQAIVDKTQAEFGGFPLAEIV